MAEIVHIDHSTGEVEIARGGSTVPLGSATGVLVSADGVVATTWENLAVDQDQVAVYAANELFAEVIGVPVLGNDGDPARRGYTTDPYWAPHLHHCYDQVTHCVHFRVPQYHVRTYTSEPGGVMAELLNSPSEPHDVALLQISGGGGAPTATIAGTDTEAGAETLLLGFTERPGPEAGPTGIPVELDTAAGRMSSSDDLATQLDAGVSGGPVVDRTTGEVLGLAGPRGEDGAATLVPADAVRAAMAEAGVEESPSKFDVVFRRGIDHLSSGNPGRSAESALEESLTYYDSALATSYLHQAHARGNEQSDGGADPAAAAGPEEGAGGSRPAAFLPILIGVLLVAGIIGAVVLRRRGAPATAGAGRRTPGAGRLSAVSSAVASVLPVKRSGDERSGQQSAAGTDRQQDSHGRNAPGLTGFVRQGLKGHKGPARHSRATDGLAGQVPAADPQPDVHPGPGDHDTRTADSRTRGAVPGPGRSFCSQCGRAVGQGARFCTGCGHRVG